MFNVQQLMDQANQLRQLGTALAARVDTATELLQQTGRPLARRLLDELGEYAASVRSLCETTATTLNLPGISDLQHVTEIVGNALTVEQEKGQLQAAVHGFLTTFLKLRTSIADTGLEREQQAAQALLTQLEEKSDEVQAELLTLISEGHHPWCGIVKLVNDRETLSDQEFEGWIETIEEKFGGRLATVLLRKKVTATDLPVTVEDPPKPTTLEPTVSATPDEFTRREEPEPTAEPAPVVESAPRSLVEDSISIFDDALIDENILGNAEAAYAEEPLETVMETVDTTPANSALFDDESTDDESEVIARAYEQTFDTPDSKILRAAQQALDANHQRHSESLSQVVLQLILDGRCGLAFHLTRSLEAIDHPITQAFPPWLIRLWTLGHSVHYSRGQLGSWLTEDFRQFAKESPKPRNSHDIARQLFARAVSLRPALVVPATGALTALRVFKMTSETTQLYNLCNRIAHCSERAQGVPPGTFQTAGSAQRTQESHAALRNDVASWKEHLSRESIRYEIANPLFLHGNWSLKSTGAQLHPDLLATWQQWQFALSHIHQIILPILEDEGASVEQVRESVDRASYQVHQSQQLAESDAELPEVITSAMRQAITYGQRWLSLRSIRTNGDAFIPENLLTLRQEFQSRYLAVVEEVETLIQNHPTSEIEVAGGCLLLALQRLHDFFSPDAVLELNEPDPRQILNGELLKIPRLRLNSQWEPVCEPGELQDAILEFLTRPQPDWHTAFELQLSHGNTDSAAKIASLTYFDSDEQRALQAKLRQSMKQKRDELWHDLEEIQRSIEEATRLDILSEQDRLGLDLRMEKTRRGLKTSTSFAAEAQEISQLRRIVEQSRAREAQRMQKKLNQLGKPPGQEGWIMDFSE